MPDPKLKNNAGGHVADKEMDRGAGLRGFAGIPTTDPEAAIRFCQNLSHILIAKPNSPTTNEFQSLLKDVSDSLVGSKVKVSGEVISFKPMESVTLLTLQDNSSKILVASFENLPSFVEKGSSIEVIGQVKIFRNQLEIIVDEIRINQ